MATDKYTLKIPQIADEVVVTEEWDFGGHRIFIRCGEVHFAIFDGELQESSEHIDNKVYQTIVKEIFVDLDGSVLDFIWKYEVKNG